MNNLNFPLQFSALQVSQIRRDGGTQQRQGNNEETVESYAEAMREDRWAWGLESAVKVVVDTAGRYWLADGFHRVEAAQRAGIGVVQARVAHGSQRDAVLYATGANAEHGLRRSRADVRRSIETLLRDEEWVKWSNREIARQVRCDDKTVASVRAELEASAEIPQIGPRTVSRNGVAYTQSAPQPRQTGSAAPEAPASSAPDGPYAHLKSCADCGTTKFLQASEGEGKLIWRCEKCMTRRGLSYDPSRLSPADRARRLGGELDCVHAPSKSGKPDSYVLRLPGRQDEEFVIIKHQASQALTNACAVLAKLEADHAAPAPPSEIKPRHLPTLNYLDLIKMADNTAGLGRLRLDIAADKSVPEEDFARLMEAITQRMEALSGAPVTIAPPTEPRGRIAVSTDEGSLRLVPIYLGDHIALVPHRGDYLIVHVGTSAILFRSGERNHTVDLYGQLSGLNWDVAGGELSDSLREQIRALLGETMLGRIEQATKEREQDLIVRAAACGVTVTPHNGGWRLVRGAIPQGGVKDLDQLDEMVKGWEDKPTVHTPVAEVAEVVAPPTPPKPREVLTQHAESIIAAMLQRATPAELRILHCLHYGRSFVVAYGDMEGMDIADDLWDATREWLSNLEDDDIAWIETGAIPVKDDDRAWIETGAIPVKA